MLTRSLAAGDVQAAQSILKAHARPPAGAAPGGDDIIGPPIDLVAAAPGIEIALPHGAFWHVRRTLAEISGDCAAIQGEYAAVLRGSRQRFDELEASAALCHIANGAPESPLFMDLETCGLAGTPIFLVGLMSWQGEQLVFDQFLARHYGEEPAILAYFAERLAGHSVLVTFNGKSFDMPQVRERSAFHGLEIEHEPPHCDLLHESRKRWRKSLPNCRLQTLEQYLCNRRRVGDIPGSAIPDAYHRFVADGNARQMKAILHHNLLDLLTMSQLLCLLLTGQDPVVD